MPAASAPPLVYLLLGPTGSGRREILCDLIEGGLAETDLAAVFVSENEMTSPEDERLDAFKTVSLASWSWAPLGDALVKTIDADLPSGATHVFFLAEGHSDPIDQIESFKIWLATKGLKLARVFCTVDCRLAEAHPPLLAWFDGCIHFSDVVFLNRREGVGNKWMSDFQTRYKDLYYPCLFELIKKGRVDNPALILEPLALRITHFFEDEADWIITDEEGEELDEEEVSEDNEEEVEVKMAEDPYMERLNGGRRVKELPDLKKFLE